MARTTDARTLRISTRTSQTATDDKPHASRRHALLARAAEAARRADAHVKRAFECLESERREEEVFWVFRVGWR